MKVADAAPWLSLAVSCVALVVALSHDHAAPAVATEPPPATPAVVPAPAPEVPEVLDVREVRLTSEDGKLTAVLSAGKLQFFERGVAASRFGRGGARVPVGHEPGAEPKRWALLSPDGVWVRVPGKTHRFP